MNRSDIRVTEWVDAPPPRGSGDGAKAQRPAQSAPVWIVELAEHKGQWARLEGTIRKPDNLSYWRVQFPPLEIIWRQGAIYARWPANISLLEWFKSIDVS